MKTGFLLRGLFVLCSVTVSSVFSQDIPVGTWRLHLSFNNVNELTASPRKIYAANEVGVMVYEKATEEISIISKANGLSSAAISAIAYADQQDILLIAFENGLINLVEANNITTFSSLTTSSAISGSRRINHITINNALAYLSTDFGVVVFDLNKREVKETYRDLNETGENLVIHESVIHQDSIFLATGQGVLSGPLNGSKNLLDFRNWKRYTEGALNNPIASVTVSNNKIYAAVSLQGVYLLESGAWVQQPYLQTSSFNKIVASSDGLIITTPEGVWEVDGVNVKAVAAGSIHSPDAAFEETDNSIWVADGKNGLLSIKGEAVTSLKPNGPSANDLWKVTYVFDKIVSTQRGFSSTIQPLGNTSGVNKFIHGQWSILPFELNRDITGIEQDANTTYVSSFINGVEKTSTTETVIYNELNSPLKKTQPANQLLIPSIELSSDGLWVINYGATPSLHLLSGSEWQSFIVDQPVAQYAIDVMVDAGGLIWLVIDPARGGGVIVFDKEENRSVYLSTVAGRGGLPSSEVRSVATDRNGQVWIGTTMGLAYFSNPRSVFSANIDASRPIFENRFLLRDETVTAIAVDGGNRKWLGTNNGVWLFDPLGEILIYNFTTDNSPLLSNKIVSIAIDPVNGEVFFATDKGMSSFRSTATKGDNSFDHVKIFPNPVDVNFAGQVAIDGLFTDAIVKITDISGRLIWQTKANGGRATWNARQVNGNRVNTGMYLVFATSEDGSERHVGKIAVIE